ncbi:MAG: hypothetical protein A3C85_03490 [Candidatus Doudnabacteria bacterium RIFCSPHIGHO2_02_FULL_48_21]|nr:MAG: hypothetical protein A3K05_03630 [Candidatus Doudnabacteria bacterium RIFCSPHIGHO2_01_48_18]OGE91305.1 MAG: hypothetical protein A3F44_03275 [Candidatus Doudnabacteria bacterium RIFCSPHIGHO2_12_FULL_47_25]OGE93303.1 MAG: hypothetical protein A3C85_03490 [Candidatus Doudnabacteria bacterium RIFCSPHIGHO2_02_FULL_48_21]
MQYKHFLRFSAFILAGVVLMTGFFVAESAFAAQSPDGSLINANGTVFLITGGQRRAFRSPAVFFSHGYNFNQVGVPSSEDLALTEGPIMIFRDGTLVKGPDNELVYLVTEGRKRGFTSAGGFLGLGYSFDNVVVSNVETFADLTEGEEIVGAGPFSSSLRHPAGTLINDNGTIFEMTATGRRAFISVEDFYSHGHDFSRVVLAHDADRLLPVEAIVRRREVIIRTSERGPSLPVLSGNLTTRERIPQNFSISAADPDGDSINYLVSWGDGSTDRQTFASGADYTVGHTWSRAGVYTVRIDVNDGYGHSASNVYYVSVNSIETTSAATSTVSVLSPAGGENLVLGRDTLNIRWSPALPGVDVIQLVSVTGHGSIAQLYGQMVQGYPTNTSGHYEYKLPGDLSFIQPGRHYINLIPAGGGAHAKSAEFTIASPIATVPPVAGLYSIASVDGQQGSYAPGAPISFKVKAVEPDGSIASYAEGFNIQAHLYNSAVGMNPSFEAANASYDASTGFWTVNLKAPSDISITYEVKVTLYCGSVRLDSLCVQRYGSIKEQAKTFRFNLTNTPAVLPSVRITAPNGGENWYTNCTTCTVNFDMSNISGHPTYVLQLVQYGQIRGTLHAEANKTVFVANSPSGIIGWTPGQYYYGGSLYTGEGAGYKIRITMNTTSGAITDESDTTFNILAATTAAPTGSPAFYKGPFKTSTVSCGDTYTFQVDGYSGSQVWLTQYKGSSSTPNYDAIYTVPTTYTSICNKDEGSYTNFVYPVVSGQRGGLLGVAYFTINPASTAVAPAPTGSPAFYKGPFKTSTVSCGDTYTFQVDGYSSSQIWLLQYKNGNIQNNGVFTVPSTYTSICPNDVGSYTSYVYTVQNGQQGSFLGSTSFSITAVQGAVTANLVPTAPTVNMPKSFQAGISQTISGYSLDPEGLPVVYTINWGDGSVVAVQHLGSGYPYQLNHSWSRAGAYIVTVTATDMSGNSRTAVIGIKVK